MKGLSNTQLLSLLAAPAEEVKKFDNKDLGRFVGKAGTVIRNRKGATRRALNGRRVFEVKWDNIVWHTDPTEVVDHEDWSEWSNARSQKAR